MRIYREAAASGPGRGDAEGLSLEHGLLFNTPAIRVVLGSPWGSRARLMDERVAAAPLDHADGDGQARRSFTRVRTAARDGCDARIRDRRPEDCGAVDRRGLVQDVYLRRRRDPRGGADTPMYPEAAAKAPWSEAKGTDGESGVIFEHVRLDVYLTGAVSLISNETRPELPGDEQAIAGSIVCDAVEDVGRGARSRAGSRP